MIKMSIFFALGVSILSPVFAMAEGAAQPFDLPSPMDDLKASEFCLEKNVAFTTHQLRQVTVNGKTIYSVVCKDPEYAHRTERREDMKRRGVFVPHYPDTNGSSAATVTE